MNLGKATKVTLSTFYNLPKLFVYRLLITLLSIGIGAAIVIPSLSFLLESKELADLIATGKELFSELFKGNDLTVFGKELSLQMKDLLVLVGTRRATIILTCVGVFIVFIVQMFLKGISNYVYGCAVNDYMSTLSNFGFFRSLFRVMKGACLYQLVYTLIKAAYSVLALLGLFYLFSALLSLTGIIALPLTFIFAVMIFALFHTLFNGFMPAAITDGKPVKAALASSFRQLGGKNRFGQVFGTYCLVLTCCVIGIFLSAIATFGAALFFSPTVCSMWMVAHSFSLYYAANDRKYYLDYDHIVVPKALREEESLLNEMDV